MNVFELPPARDGDAAMMGRWGLANPLSAWLMRKGFGEILGMTPAELEHVKRSQAYCHAPAQWGYRCNAPMLLRADSKGKQAYWACYKHGDEPVRKPFQPLRTIEVDATIEEMIGQVADFVYDRGKWQMKPQPTGQGS